MKRRQYLRGTGAAVSAALAGCTSVLDGTDPAQAREHITAAEDLLEENGEDIAAVSESFQDDEEPASSYDPDPVETNVERLNGELDDAEEVATDEQLAYVEELRAIGEYQVELAHFLSEMVELYSRFDTVVAYVESDRYEDALDEFDAVDSLVESARSRVADVEAAVAEVDTSVLAEADRYEFENTEQDLAELDEILEVLGIFLEGYRPMIEGFVDFTPAVEAYQNSRYQEAAEGFAKAEEDFTRAAEAMRKLEDADAELTGLEADVVRVVCVTEALAEATDLFRESAVAAMNGDSQLALQKAEEARQAFSGCGMSQ